MNDYLIIKLKGPMQAWGEHSFEGLRPSGNIPTKSALLGLLGACLGIERNDPDRSQELANSVGFAVRQDEVYPMEKITDYHSVQDARVEYTGSKSHATIQTWREYLLDAQYTVAVWNHHGALVSLNTIETKIKYPEFTPYLGRRSCPLSRPLFETRLKAQNSRDALQHIEPQAGVIFSEEPGEARMIRVRDVPITNQPRQFASRNLYIYGGDNVSE
ncbi:MAG: type I-E CRISPR-associated protein Cas5/CasD [Thermodesulfobacteriota bacterium]|nr:type I-E CRISPR-associated protein Cas5/CasD [Thermodesulfobacteriota bacterium]